MYRLLPTRLIFSVFVSLHLVSFCDTYLHGSEQAAGSFYPAFVVYLSLLQFAPRLHLQADGSIHSVAVSASRFCPSFFFKRAQRE
jgi:hypothetical protein